MARKTAKKATKKAAKTAKNPAAKHRAVDKKSVVKDLQAVLKSHGITAKIQSMSFASTSGSVCHCPDGQLGVWRVVGNKLVCVCDG